MRPAERVLGIDPGARWTGLVIRCGNEVIAHQVVANGSPELAGDSCGVGGVYLADVASAAEHFAEARNGRPVVDLVAIEGVRRPNPHVAKGRRSGNHVIDPTHVIATGIVFGWLLAHFPDATVVPAGGNGAGLLAAYPGELATPGERRHGLNRPAPQSSDMRHARSAYDVAGAALLMQRASKPARSPSR